MSSLKAAIAMPQQWKSAVSRTDFKILPLVKIVFDILLPIALTAGVALIMIVGASFLLAKGNAWQGYEAWLGFIKRLDTLATITLTALVTATYVTWRQGRERR
jgi:hypothetical protein